LMTQSDQKSALGAVWVARPGIDDLKTRGLWGGQCGVMVSVRYQYNIPPARGKVWGKVSASSPEFLRVLPSYSESEAGLRPV
jgi:hypothetical protein